MDKEVDELGEMLLMAFGTSSDEFNRKVKDAYQAASEALIKEAEKAYPAGPLRVMFISELLSNFEAKSIAMRTAMGFGEGLRDAIHETAMVEASAMNKLINKEK